MRKNILAIIIFTCLAKFSVSGQHWSTLGEGMADVPYYQGAWINAITMYNGEVYAGGVFDTAGGIAVNRIAKWNGSSWSSVGGGIILNGGPNGHVRTMIVYRGELYVGGFFDSAGSIAAKNIAKWNGTDWSAVGTGVNNVVIDFAEYNGDLIAGGAFDTAGGVIANRIAKWNGTNWSAVGEGIDPDWYVNHLTSVYALTVHNGILYAGGAFDTAGSVPANNIARWDGTNWSSVGQGVQYGIVYSLAVYEDSVYAGGTFWMAGTDLANHVAKWNGTNWSPVGEGTDFSTAALAVYNGKLYAGGFYANYSDGTGDGVGEYYPSNYIAKWEGTYWSGVGQGVNGSVFELFAADSSLYIGGSFTHADTLAVNRIAKWSGNCSNPPQPGIINGNDVVCNSSTQTYFVNPVAGATSYTWFLPMEWPGSSTTNSITTTPYYDGNFNISVRANNACGYSPIQTIPINVLLTPSPPEYITGSTIVCQGSIQTYLVNPIPGVTDYSWTLPAGWTGSSSTSSITVTTGNGSGNISVRVNNICGSSDARTLAVRVDSIISNPQRINGDVLVPVNQKNTYSINPVNGAAGYTWSLSGGGTIVTGQNTNSITINWDAPGEYTLSVNANNSCGPGNSESLTIKVSAVNGDPFGLQLFPNPTSGQYYLKVKGVQNRWIAVEVFSMAGQLVLSSGKRLGSNDYSQLIDVNKLASGLYAVKIIIDDKVYTKQVLITR